MANKAEQYARLAEDTAGQLTGSLQQWTAFLTTAGRLYKYPYHEQLLIYAQRPDATACAEYDLWNRTMRRYVRRGSRGIALVDPGGDQAKIRYVFDVSDTGGRENSRRPYLWEYREEHRAAITSALESRFEVPGTDTLAEQLEGIAARLTDEYWDANQRDILGIVDGSFLEGYDDFNIGAAFRNAALVSATYTLLSRCGLDPEESFVHEDFLPVFDFNTPAAVAALGTAVSQVSEQVLRQIEVSIKNYEREKLAERSQSHDEPDLHTERGLSDPGPDPDRAGGEAPGQVREDAEEVPSGASSGAVESDDPERDPVPAPAGDRGDSQPPAGADDARSDESGGGDGGPESPRPDDLGRPDEQLQGPGGRSDPSGADLQLNEDPGAEPDSQFSLFPSEAEQLQIITEAESAPAAPFAFSLPQEDIDHLLRLGSNTEDARTKLVLENMKQKPLSELTAFVKETFHDGYGLQTENGRLSSWAADDGLHILRGSSVRYARTAQVLSWEDATARIGELLEQGQFATNLELSEAPGFERRQLAESLWYLYGDVSDAARDGGWLPTLRENYLGGFPDATERLTKLLEDPEARRILVAELEAFSAVWEQDRSLMRFRTYRPDVLIRRVEELSLPRREYVSDMVELPTVPSFITEDEIDANLSRGGSFEGGTGRIYSFWQQEHTPKEKADFLKHEYGTGGGNGAVSRNFHSWEDHSAKGILLRKPDAEDVSLSWAKVAKRIDALIEKDRYLTPEGKAAWEQAQAEARQVTDAAVSPRQLTPVEIDAALRTLFPDIETKHAVIRYMDAHGREKDTAAWLASQYYGTEDRTPLYLTIDGGEATLPWSRVQRRIAQLIQKDDFYTEEERDNFEDIDPIAIREQLERPGPSPFVQQVIADLEWIAQEEEANAPDPESILSSEEIDTVEAEPSETRDFNPYHVGDTVYLDDTAYEITAVNAVDVQLRDPAQTYPIFRTENREAFERGLYRDRRNAPITDFLAANLDRTSGYLRDALTWEGGLVEPEQKEQISELFRNGSGNERVASFLAAVYAGNSIEMTMPSGDTGILTSDVHALDLRVQDQDGGAISMSRTSWENIATILRAMYQEERNGFFHEGVLPEPETRPSFREETTDFFSGERTGLPFDIEIQTLRIDEPEHDPPAPSQTAENFRITDDHLGEGGPKAKFRANMDAIYTLKTIENEGRAATQEEQEILSRYVGWGGLADAFDPDKREWTGEFKELEAALTQEEYAAARGSTLNAHYTSPTVIRAIYEAVGNMGFQIGNILEPSMGVGNFFGMLPEEMSGSRLYGVELDSITGRIAQQLYPKANITVAGFETTDRRDFFDLAVGNVPFGNYKVNDRAYNKLGFSIHNYFFAKALDQVRPGGVVAFVTSRYMMDGKDSAVRKYLAERADLLGAIRLPNNAFRANAGTDVVSDIIFLQKRETPMAVEPDWVHLGENETGFTLNSYFIDHPEMILGRQAAESTQYGRDEFTVLPIEGLELSDQLHDAIKYIRGTYREAELPDLEEGADARKTIPADPDVKNFSFAVVDGEVYYRENSIMTRADLNATAKERVRGLVELRDSVHALIDLQMDEYSSESEIKAAQEELNRLYDAFSAKYGLINDRANRLAFSDDSAYYLLCSLEVLDENGKLDRKADFFTKRTIKQQHSVDHVDTASEALAVSIGEKACVDIPFMAQLTGKSTEEVISDLRGVIFKDPNSGDAPDSGWQTTDEYLSGNVRQKLRTARRAAERDPAFQINVEALEKAQPKDLDASEIEVRLGATWIDPSYIQRFMEETFEPPYYLRHKIKVHYSPHTAEWQVEGKSVVGHNDIAAYTTFGTGRANAYRLLEESLNLRDIRIYDTIEDADGKERRVLNAKETTLAAQKQQAIREAFKDWIWKDPERRASLVKQYNEEMNSTRPREYDGSHLVFSGMNPEITLREHQRNAIAHVLYGGNTLLAHEVGAGKTFEMVAAAMESKRLGLCSKSMFVVPNHLVDQWASEFLRLYPAANILVTTKKDFEKHNRQKFCARIATGNYDAVIIGHSQFERIPVSAERQARQIEEQIDDITDGIDELEGQDGERFTIKQLEKTKKSLEAKLEKLLDSPKDDVVTFEQLGVDRLFVDESDNYKNLFLYTKMRNVAGLSTSDAQKSSDMFAKCRYMDELTGSRGVVFATGTPVSNSMTELYTIQRYLQYDRLQELGMGHFDCWASRFGETASALELAPEGTGYRMRTRFAKFFNLPELMNLFKEVADIKTADQLHLPTPEVEYHTYSAKPTEIQKEYVKSLSERATQVHNRMVEPNVDNMLKITSDGRKLGLDQRLINPLLPDEEGTKVNQCVENILQFWRDGEDKKLTQLVFSDLSTPKGKSRAVKVAAKAEGGNLETPEEETIQGPFTIYEDIRQKLIAGGMRPEQIAFIHDADTEVKKRELFSKVRSGQVRVLIGSTQKMGAGTNVQDRLIALHDLDCRATRS